MDKFKFKGSEFETKEGLLGYYSIALEVCQWCCANEKKMISDIGKNIGNTESKFDLKLILRSYLQMAIAHLINDQINVIDPDNIENVKIIFCQLAKENGIDLFKCTKCESGSICSMADLGPVQ